MARQLYEKQEWEDLPSENTPISGERLGHIEQGIYDNSENMALREVYKDDRIDLTMHYKIAGEYAIQHGNRPNASGKNSYAGGSYTESSGNDSHAEGSYTKAKGHRSHSEGNFTIAGSDDQHVQGKYNVQDTENKFAHIVGGGTSVYDTKNIHTLDWQGNAMYAGTVESKGLILADTVTEQKYILTIANGNIEITAVE